MIEHKIGTKKTKAGFEASIYELTSRAYLAPLLEQINLDRFTEEAEDHVVLYALAVFSTATKLLSKDRRPRVSEGWLEKRRAPVAVFLERKVNELYSSLNEEDAFKKAIDKGLDALKENIFAGEIIRKKQIPKYYINRFGINNLYRLGLDRKRRCCYTIVADEEGFKVVVIEVFPDHKSYNRRFGYRKN